jgi:hypothetical protein
MSLECPRPESNQGTRFRKQTLFAVGPAWLRGVATSAGHSAGQRHPSNESCGNGLTQVAADDDIALAESVSDGSRHHSVARQADNLHPQVGLLTLFQAGVGVSDV